MEIKYFLAIMLISFFITSCDETNSPSSDYLIEKTVNTSTEEQTIESGSDFKMIFPANSLKGNLEIKVKKENSAPNMNIPNQKPGKNFFKIKFSGDADFLKPIQLLINYDKSAIPVGKTVQESVFGYIYSSGGWKLADYQLDETNGKIIINISSIFGKTNKDEPILLNDGEIIIGYAYTITDDGNEDELLNKMIYFWTIFAFQGIRDDDIIMDLSFDILNTSSDNFQKVKWNSNKFTITNNDSSEFSYSKFTASGEIDKSNWTLKNYKLQYLVYDNYSSMSTHLEEYNIEFNDIKGNENEYGSNPIWLTFAGVYNGSGKQSNFKNAVKAITYKITNYEIDGTTISNEHILKSVNWNNYTNQIHFNLYQVKQ